MSEANLAGADLHKATGRTAEHLELDKFLEGSTMPNGQKYED